MPLYIPNPDNDEIWSSFLSIDNASFKSELLFSTTGFSSTISSAITGSSKYFRASKLKTSPLMAMASSASAPLVFLIHPLNFKLGGAPDADSIGLYQSFTQVTESVMWDFGRVTGVAGVADLVNMATIIRCLESGKVTKAKRWQVRMELLVELLDTGQKYCATSKGCEYYHPTPAIGAWNLLKIAIWTSELFQNTDSL